MKLSQRDIHQDESHIQDIPNYRVYKHNDLVECKSDFSATEHRIILLAMAQIKPRDHKLRLYRINIRDVLGKQHRSHYNIVRKAVRRLHKSTIEMEEEDGWKSYSFITFAQGKYRDSFIELQFHQDIQKFLLGLKTQYTTYTLDNVIKFKRNYSLRIYELCKQYVRIGNRIIELDYLKTLLSLEDKYEEFFNFKNNVLTPAIEEINKYSDIEVGFVERRNGKKVQSISFYMHRKRLEGEKDCKTLAEVDVDQENLNKFLHLGFTDDEFYVIRNKYGSERLCGVLAYFEKHIDEIHFPKAWIEKALKDNYVDASAYKKQLATKEETIEKLRKKLSEIEKHKRIMREQQERIDQIESDIEYYQEIGKLKESDVMRYPQEYTVEDAITDLETRLKECYNERLLQEEELEKLESEKETLKGF